MAHESGPGRGFEIPCPARFPPSDTSKSAHCFGRVVLTGPFGFETEATWTFVEVLVVWLVVVVVVVVVVAVVIGIDWATTGGLGIDSTANP
jgi:hypothetical protein